MVVIEGSEIGSFFLEELSGGWWKGGIGICIFFGCERSAFGLGGNRQQAQALAARHVIAFIVWTKKQRRRAENP